MTLRRTASISGAFALSLTLFCAPYVVVLAEPVPEAPQEPAAQEGSAHGEAQVETGDAASDAAVLNEANTADAEVEGAAQEEPQEEVPAEEEAAPAPEAAQAAPQLNGTTTAEAVQEADLLNNATSSAATGQNDASGGAGASIATGDGSASAYLLSIFNMALTNSSGEILFLRNPLASELDLTARIKRLFEDLTGGEGSCSFLSCTTGGGTFNFWGHQTARVENNLHVSCDTGGNRATSTHGTASVVTGDCLSSGVIVNFGNLILADSRYLVLLMDQSGDLEGNIVLPDGSFFKTLSGGASSLGGTSLSATSTALIGNNASAGATTGGNTASTTGDAGASVETGDARASASVLNIANRLGAPICFIISVGGEWDGQVHQLPAGFTHESTPFGEFFCGSGGASRPGPSNFSVEADNYAELLNNALVEASTGGNTAVGDGARIETGDASSFLRILNLVNQTIVGQDWLFGLFTVAGDWRGDLIFGVLPGGSPQDQLAGGLLSGGGHANGELRLRDASIIFEKTGTAGEDLSSAQYEIRVRNRSSGGPAYGVVVTDTITAPGGATLHTEVFEVGDLLPGEEVLISYEVELTPGAPRGSYTNTAVLRGTEHAAEGGLSSPLSLTVAHVMELGSGEVLGACAPYLTDNIRPGAANDPAQVLLLKSFLQDTQGEALDGTGVYDRAAIEAVQRFQRKYADDILSPWGMSEPTGNVYHTTKLKINELVCGDANLFGLTDIQIDEIRRWRSAVWDTAPVPLAALEVAVPETSDPMPAPAAPQHISIEAPNKERSVLGRLWEWLTSRMIRVAEAAW